MRNTPLPWKLKSACTSFRRSLLNSQLFIQCSGLIVLNSAISNLHLSIYEPPRDKTNNVTVHPAKTQISLGIPPVWSESSLSAWRKLGSLATHWVHSEDSDKTGRMPRLIWVFTGRTVILLVLSWGRSYMCSAWATNQDGFVFQSCTQSGQHYMSI